MVTEELYAGIAQVRARSVRAAYLLASLRAHPEVIMKLARSDQASLQPSLHWQVLGLDVVVDDHLPRGVWRLCDADGGLLWDCRAGRPMSEWLQVGRS